MADLGRWLFIAVVFSHFNRLKKKKSLGMYPGSQRTHLTPSLIRHGENSGPNMEIHAQA